MKFVFHDSCYYCGDEVEAEFHQYEVTRMQVGTALMSKGWEQCINASGWDVWKCPKCQKAESEATVKLLVEWQPYDEAPQKSQIKVKDKNNTAEVKKALYADYMESGGLSEDDMDGFTPDTFVTILEMWELK